MKNLQNPQVLARTIAEVLESDPIAAAQVQEYIKPARLMTLLNLKPYLASIPTSKPMYETRFYSFRHHDRPVIDEENT